MIAGAAGRDPLAAHGGRDPLPPLEQPCLLRSELQADPGKRAVERERRIASGAGVAGEHPEVVDPPQVVGARGGDGVVGRRQDGVGEHRRRFRAHRQAGHSGSLERLQERHELLHVVA